MTYILMIWTTIAIGGGSPTFNGNVARDWRPIGEFHDGNIPPQLAKEKCETAARQLGLKTENYRCIRSK